MNIYQQLPQSFYAREHALSTAWDRSQLPKQLVTLPPATLETLERLNEEFVPLIKQRDRWAGKVLAILANKREAYQNLHQAAINLMMDFQALVYNKSVLPSERRHYFNLAPDNRKLGIPKAEGRLVARVKVILEAEAQRRSDGCTPMNNNHHDHLKECLKAYQLTYSSAMLARSEYSSVQQDLLDAIPEVDSFISELWTLINLGLKTYKPSTKRRFAQEYGVFYVLRKEGGETTPASEGDLGNNDSVLNDPMLAVEIAPGTHPDDDLGVEQALEEAGMGLDSDVPSLLAPDADDDDASGQDDE